MTHKQRASFFGAGFIVLAGVYKKLRPTMWRWFYNRLARKDKQNDLLFMNYGFSDPETEPLELENDQELYRFPIQLYQHVVQLDIKNKHLAEIGCGRGGGADFITRSYQPCSYTAIDLSDEAIEFCMKTHKFPGLTFLQGSADNLPLADDSMDVIINIESSHCYPSLENFIQEVCRVLVPNGYFLICDMRSPKKLDEFRATIAAEGLEIIQQQNITQQVLSALDTVSDSRAASIHSKVPRLFKKAMRDFVALRGTSIYEMFKDGRLNYYSHTCQYKR